MRKVLLLPVMFLLAVLIVWKLKAVTPDPPVSEDDHVRFHCKGHIEYTLADKTRVDCLTTTHAYEYDYAEKWAESVGQALHYAHMTDRIAGVVLIKKRGEGRYVKRVREIIRHYGLPLELRAVNFGSLEEPVLIEIGPGRYNPEVGY